MLPTFISRSNHFLKLNSYIHLLTQYLKLCLITLQICLVPNSQSSSTPNLTLLQIFPIKAHVICSILVAHMKILKSINFSHFLAFIHLTIRKPYWLYSPNRTTCHHLYPQASIKSCSYCNQPPNWSPCFYHTFNSQYHSQCDPF